MRVVNVGGSLTTALVLSAAAWGVRLLRANNILRPAERPGKPAARASSKALHGRLSPVAFRLLARPCVWVTDLILTVTLSNSFQLELEAVPFLIIDVRAPDEAQSRPLSGILGQSFASRAKAVLLPGAHHLLSVVLSRKRKLSSTPRLQNRMWLQC